jgi:hypothetical protein
LTDQQEDQDQKSSIPPSNGKRKEQHKEHDLDAKKNKTAKNNRSAASTVASAESILESSDQRLSYSSSIS